MSTFNCMQTTVTVQHSPAVIVSFNTSLRWCCRYTQYFPQKFVKFWKSLTISKQGPWIRWTACLCSKVIWMHYCTWHLIYYQDFPNNSRPSSRPSRKLLETKTKTLAFWSRDQDRDLWKMNSSALLSHETLVSRSQHWLLARKKPFITCDHDTSTSQTYGRSIAR